jgi:hypothetical protein
MVTLTDIMQVLAMSPLPTLTSYLVPLVMAAKNHATSGQRYLKVPPPRLSQHPHIDTNTTENHQGLLFCITFLLCEQSP